MGPHPSSESGISNAHEAAAASPGVMGLEST